MDSATPAGDVAPVGTPAGPTRSRPPGVNGSLTRTATATLVVNQPPDFTLSASPSSRTVGLLGGSTSYTINPTGGFTGQVMWSVSGLPSGANGSRTPRPRPRRKAAR